MKALNKAIASGVALISMSVVGFAATPMVYADGTGQLEGGTIFYQVKNYTQNSAYSTSATAACGDEVEYSVRLHNTGFEPVNNINLSATLNGGASTATATYTGGVVPSTSSSVNVTLPSGGTLAYESGSTNLYNGSATLVQSNIGNITSGVNLGSLNGSTTEFVNFKAKVNCETPVTPVYTCDALTVNASDNKTVTVSALKTTAQNGATFNNATINWGDNTASTTASNVAGVSHTYAAAGSYTITATANFTVNGQAQTATSNACKQVVSFSSTTPPTVTPPAAPTQLVNTGAGDTIGIFAAVVAISTIAYRFVLGRRLSRQ